MRATPREQLGGAFDSPLSMRLAYGWREEARMKTYLCRGGGRLLAALVTGVILAGVLTGCGEEEAQPVLLHPRKTVPVILAAGDIAACDSNGDEATARLIAQLPGTVAALGDEVYEDGSSDEFNNCYAPSWGRFRARTRPTPGNHEYHTSDAAGYFGYFDGLAGAVGKGWYSYRLGKWHIVVLNSNCSDVGGCDAGSQQGKWLRS